MKKYFGVVVILFLAIIMIYVSPGLTLAEEAAFVQAETSIDEEPAMQHETESMDEETQKAAPLEEQSSLSISRLIICSAVDNREPVGATDTFSASTEEAFCFIEAKDIAQDTQVAVAWSWGEDEIARVYLTLKKSPRWRTYSSKKLAGLKGDWKVEVLDEQGKSVKAASFSVK